MKEKRRSWGWLLGAMLVSYLAAASAQEAATEETAAVGEPTAEEVDPAVEEAVAAAEGFPPEQIEQLLAPIALYPDALLAQLLMASTYPLDIVQASRWVRDHSDLEGEALEQAAAEEGWDPSVQALVFFPDVLAGMSDNLDWTQDLGEAYLGQEQEVLDAVQRLRLEAHEAGNLETNEHQQVVVEGDTVVVQPAEPEVVYVPSYNPSTVYAQPAPTTTYYPAVYEESSSSSSDVVTFATGALVGGLLTAAIMWDRNDNYCCGVYYGGPGRWGSPGYWGRSGYWDGGWRRPVNIDRNVNIRTGDINVDRSRRVGKWEHNPTHRGNINYKNQKTKAKYSKDLRKRPVDRDVARGYKRDARPATRDVTRTAARDAKRPEARKRPEQVRRDGKQTQRRDANLKRPEGARTKTREAQKPQTREVRKPQQKQTTRTAQKTKRGGDAFKKSNARTDRAASNRGHRSVNRSGGARRSGGGGGRAGGRRG